MCFLKKKEIVHTQCPEIFGWQYPVNFHPYTQMGTVVFQCQKNYYIHPLPTTFSCFFCWLFENKITWKSGKDVVKWIDKECGKEILYELFKMLKGYSQKNMAGRKFKCYQTNDISLALG